MALTQNARNKIKSFVQAAKKLLMTEFESQLQQYYGIRPNGSCLMVEELTSKDASIIQIARLLRERLNYLEETIAGTNKIEEAVQQLIREQAFTILNRFAAIRMAEERNIIQESIRKGYNSEGYLVFDQLTGGAKTADQFTRYTWYIKAVFDELAIDIPAVFDRFSPYALLFPSERVLLDLLAIINDEDLVIYREEGQQPINLWKEDETIGWVYQYYNSREEISAMREASGAPRNSRELAVRNQFFTPRYVVQFLVDNSLGRQWYEMTQGNTELTNQCQYMVKRPSEVFLQKGEQLPKDKNEETHYVEYRVLKDPREILMLDPACGSMHFGLYSFDLYEQIYKEAWDNHPELMPDLRDKYLREEFIGQIPEMIIRYNIHGVDIDPRAIQIAGLSLWLRAQKFYDDLNLQPKNRPPISKSNLVVAEPMPGDVHMLSEFTKSLPGPIGKLVRVIWNKMKLAGETGMLLKIEEELKNEIEIAKQEWQAFKKTSSQTALFDPPKESKVSEMAAIYGKGQKISKDFFDTAEEQVLDALKNFAENAEGEHVFKKLLFAEDTARGFAFIELCRKRYDVIVMNPPFGDASSGSKKYLDSEYKRSSKDLAAVFVERCFQLQVKDGRIGCISTRNIFYLGSYDKWRKDLLIQGQKLEYFADLGMGVLDAMVETSAYILSNKEAFIKSIFFRLTNTNSKAEFLQKNAKEYDKSTFKIDISLFLSFNNYPFCYWVDTVTTALFSKEKKFDNGSRGARQGMKTGDNDRYVRNLWELSSPFRDIQSRRWNLYLLSDYSVRFYLSQETVVNYENDAYELKHHYNEKGQLRSRPMDTYNVFNKEGLSWSFRTNKFKPHFVREGHIAQPGRCIAVFEDRDEIFAYLSFWNSDYADYLMKLGVERAGHPKFINGLVNNLPHPTFSPELKNKLISTAKELVSIVGSIFSLEEQGVDFENNQFIDFGSLDEFAKYRKNELIENSKYYLINLTKINKDVFEYFKISNVEDIYEIINQSGGQKEEIIFKTSAVASIDRIFSILVGIIFGRFDIRLLKKLKNEWLENSVFNYRPHSPFIHGPKESTLDLVLPEYHNKIKEIWEMPYPLNVLNESATVSDINSITEKLEEVIKYFWPETSDTIIYELQEHFKVTSLEEIFDKQSKFFNVHLKDYSRNKRISPIYWHLGIPSGKFNVWIYYPKLNENSPYKIVNELIDPKLEEVNKEVNVLEMSSSAKELNDKKEFLHELEDFKTEILRIAQLPYKPNQDDGVLITAAPLHNLFHHTKWRKSTEDCWKKLEKGEYDWAHLAYSIWPDRVRQKCKKDLSMAIAHGLEDICEVKPKEIKEKKSKTQEVKQLSI